MEAPDNAQLLRRAAGGEQAAWDALVGRHADLLWAIARGHRLGAADAADAIQTTWLRLLENVDRIADPDRITGWLATTLRRECLRLLRRRDRERPSEADDLEVVDAGPDLDEGLLLAERDAQLWAAFVGLPDRCQHLLRVLMATPPPSYDAVSAALEMPIGSIGPTRARCLQRLRGLLNEEQGGLLCR